MMDTNSIATLAPQSFTSSLNAWHLVALGVGVFVTHAYHAVVNAGGVRTIWRKFMGPKI